MSPSKGAGRARRKPAKRRSRAGLAIAFLGVLAAAVCGAALYFGFLPGPGSLLGAGGTDPLPNDSTLAARVDPAGAATSAPPTDSAAVPPLADSTSAGVAGAAGATPTAVDSAAGDAVYHGAGRCVGCHGATGEGVAGLGSTLRDSASLSGGGTPGAIARVVAGGAPPSARFRIAMPSYAGQLGPEDIGRVAAYVFALAHPGRLAADTAAAPQSLPPLDAGATNANGPATVRHPTVPLPPLTPAPRRP